MILDFNLVKLYDELKKIHASGDEVGAEVFLGLIEGYTSGDISVVWEGGEPYFKLSESYNQPEQLCLDL